MHAHDIRIRPHQPSMMHGQPGATVFIIDNDESARESLNRVMRAAGWHVESFAAADEFLARPRAMRPGCLIVEVDLPRLGGLDLQKMIADRRETPVLFLTDRHDVQLTVRAMKAGAVDFLTKPCTDTAVLRAVETAINISRRSLAHEASVRSLKDRHASLSAREQQVLTLVVAGLLNKQIAAELDISVITVKSHRGRVMRKMAASSLAHLVDMVGALRSAAPPESVANGVGKSRAACRFTADPAWIAHAQGF